MIKISKSKNLADVLHALQVHFNSGQVALRDTDSPYLFEVLASGVLIKQTWVRRDGRGFYNAESEF